MEVNGEFRFEENHEGKLLYICRVDEAFIDEQFARITSIKGVHKDGKSNIDVEDVRFYSTTVHYFPRGLHKIFPNIKEIEIMSCDLKHVTSRDLIGLENLENLDLSYNHLTSLPPDLLKNMKQLKRLDFHHNRLEFVSSQMLSTQYSHLLTYVNFRKNQRIDVFFEQTVLTDCSTLQILKNEIHKNCLPPIETKSDLKAQKPSKSLIEKFKALWKSGRFTDFVIEVESTEFPVHKIVLAVQSSVFDRIFDTDMKESNSNRMVITDFSATAVGDFLNYLYYEEVPSEQNAMELFALAAKYDVPDLKAITGEIVFDNIDESNALEVLEFANLHGCEDMIEQAFSEIKSIVWGIHLKDEMKTKPEKIRKLIEAKQILDEKLIKADDLHNQQILEANHEFEAEVELLELKEII